jgi:hypothetical protein
VRSRIDQSNPIRRNRKWHQTLAKTTVRSILRPTVVFSGRSTRRGVRKISRFYCRRMSTKNDSPRFSIGATRTALSALLMRVTFKT